MNKNLKIKCPHCAKVFLFYESEARPFCSERCKMIDLGHWFQESYRVPEKDSLNELGENDEEKNNEEECLEDESDH